MPLEGSKKFSVIIPVYNEEGYIKLAIIALKNQNLPRQDFEIIVVDNNSNDATAEVAKNAGADKVVKELKQGTNMARQRGFLESRGKIVVFLDADSKPPIDWLTKIKKILLQKDVAAVSGPFDYQFQGFKKILDFIYVHFILSYLDKFLYFFFRKKAGVIIGGNFAAWRWAIEKIGGLPPLKFFGDDAAIAMLLSREAGKVIFTPQLKVISSQRRFEKQGFLKLAFKYARSYLKIYFS